ncbi:ABC transporter permease [Alicyclobacillus acidiphilus]|uniref:ABC transporter permease n=1 Tax=Alicyclobacillus acidiphilus TaxID=182455 RepID=UPI0009F942EA|nr:ABC transporter permease [Alicyclobacillus acidiphilus]
MSKNTVKKRRFPNELGILAVLIVVFVIFGVLSPNFFTVSNTMTLLLNTTDIAILSIGQTFVLLTAGIDLSVGSGIALSGVVAALSLQAGMPWPVAVILALLSTVLIGLFNGAIIHYVKVPAFIVTFATMGVASSIPLIVTNAMPIAILNQTFGKIGQGFVGPVPLPVCLLIVFGLAAWILLSKTVFGMHVFAVGGNRASARLAGVNTAKVDLLVYTISGLMSGFAGIVDASRLMSGYPTAGSGNELFYSISAAVVGGVSLFGGIGSIPGALIGSVLIGTISDGMNVLNVNSNWQPLVIGLIILIGVTVDTLRTARQNQQTFWKTLSMRFAFMRQNTAA